MLARLSTGSAGSLVEEVEAVAEEIQHVASEVVTGEIL